MWLGQIFIRFIKEGMKPESNADNLYIKSEGGQNGNKQS